MLISWISGHGMHAVWLVTCASVLLLGVACLRGWNAVRWAWLLWHGLLLSSFLWTSFTRPLGESLWIASAGYAALYALAVVVLWSKPARAFFRPPAPPASEARA